LVVRLSGVLAGPHLVVHAVLRACASLEISAGFFTSYVLTVSLALHAPVATPPGPAVAVPFPIATTDPASVAVCATVAATSCTVVVVIVVRERRSCDRYACDEHCHPPTFHSCLL
jgi:hypothetical protein